ncbi:unnamed protein product [Rotaria socialis]
MSVLEIRHEFFDTEARNNEQLYQAFCNHVYFGQWELCRICLQILFNKRLQLNTNLEELLIDIIRNPTAYCTGSKSVPTPFHFALLLVEECRIKQYLDATLIESLKYDAMYKFLLAVGDIQPTAQVVQEFDRIHTDTDSIPSNLLTDSMADFLVDLWLNETSRVHALIRYYFYSSLPSMHVWLIQIHKRALDLCLQQLKSLNNEQEKRNLVDLLLSLHFYSCDTNDFRQIMCDTLKKIVIYAAEANNNDAQLFNLKCLYRAVLINGDLARFISELESEYRRELLGNDTAIIHFLKKNSFEQESFFWKEIYLYLIENKLDLISCILNDSVLMVKNRDYSSFDQLLNIEQLTPLHLYIFLLTWTHVRTINDAIVLHDAINRLKTENCFLSKCLKLFQSHTEFITWLYNVRRIDLNYDGASASLKMSDLLALLHTSSPLSLMHRYLDIDTIDSADILKKLEETSVDIDDDNERRTQKKLPVRFEDDPKRDIPLPREAACMIFLGYLSINSVVECILSPVDSSNNNNNQPDNDLFATARTHLTKIFPLRFRLELLENIFSLIFLQQRELKVGDTVEVIERSVNAASSSLSPSENLFSSIRSNLTNDSFHASSNVSIRTQLSARRFRNNFDENTDDNVSVCSSSMSSVGASHLHSLNRTGLLIDQQVLHKLLSFLRDQLSDVRTLHQKIKDKAEDRYTVTFETLLDKYFQGCSISTSEQFTSRAGKLNKTLSETSWRYQLLTSDTSGTSSQENKIDGQDNDDSLVSNSSVKNLILPVPRRKRRRSRHSDSSVSSVTSSVSTHTPNNKKSALVSQILSSRDNLLAICLKEGKITEANEVIRLFSMEHHPLAVEAKFSKLFRDTINKLSNSYSSSGSTIDNSCSKSVLAGLATLASSALDNTSVQNDIGPLLEAAQSSDVSSTLPTSNYFDHEHFVSLTLFDLAINAPTITISKTLLDLAQLRLPIPRSVFSSNNTTNNKNSTTRIKTLNEMINNYINLANSSNSSFYDLLLDVTIPLDGPKATKTIQYYKRLDEHCRQYYSNEQNRISIEKQVQMTGEFFENDPHTKLDLITYIRNASNQTKVPSTIYINYFSIFHTYLQNFRILLEKFPLQDVTSDFDLLQHSPLSLIHRIVARSSDIDLAQLQFMTTKLNIDISLAVTLNIIRPLFVDKTMPTSSLAANRRTTLLQQQPLDIFSYCQQYQTQQPSPSMSNSNNKRQLRRSTTFLKRLASKLDDFQNEPNSFNEHPEKFVRTLLARLLDSIKKVIHTTGHNHMTIEDIEKLLTYDHYDDIVKALPLLTYVDLDRLKTNEERICFFTNLYNFLLIISHVELIRTKLTQMTTTIIFRNELERLLFILTTHIDIGQLKQISLYDIRYFILKQNGLVDGLKLDLDPKGPFYRYAPVMNNYQNVKVGLLLNDCTYSSSPFIILTPELLNEQLQCSTKDFIEKCIVIKKIEIDNSIQIRLPSVLYNQFDPSTDEIIKFIREYLLNSDLTSAINENLTIRTEVIPSLNDFAISFDYRLCSSQFEPYQGRRHRRTSSFPSLSTIATLSSPIDFLPQSANLPSHLIDSRTISFVQEKSPALGQILQIYVQCIVHNKPIQSDNTPLKNYFTSLLLPPTLIQSTSSIGDEWFRSIVLNDLTYQYDLLLYLCSLLWNDAKYTEIVELFDSLLPSFIVHSPYFQILRDLALLSLVKQTSEPDRAFNYVRKIHDCHLLIHGTLTYLPRFDGPTCLQLLQLCLTSCKKTHQDYIPWIQERLSIMYVYKTLCLSALAQFNKCMEKISKDDGQLNMSIEDMATRKTSSKCLTWQHAEEHSQRDPLAVVEMFIVEKQFDMGHKWLTLLNNYVDENVINCVRLKLVEEHINWLLKEENIGNGNKILQIIDTIEKPNDKWRLCTELIEDLSKKALVTHTKSIPFSRLFIKFRLIQYMLGHFEENSILFRDDYDRSKLCILVTGLALFFNCIPLEQTDSYVQLVGQPLLIFEQLLMNSSIDIAKLSIETLKVLIKKYSLDNIINIKQIDQIIEFYTKKSVRLNVVQLNEEQTPTENKSGLASSPASQIETRRSSLISPSQASQNRNTHEPSPLGRRNNSSGSNNLLNSLRQRMSSKSVLTSSNVTDADQNVSTTSYHNSPVMSSSIPIKAQQQQATSSSFFDYLSSSLSNRSNTNEQTPKTATQPMQSNEFILPAAIPARQLWISDGEVAICMCCNEAQFSMFNRRHHCRRCGRVVCKACSQQMTIIKSRLERTCKDCYQHMQNNPTPAINTRQETSASTKKFENLRHLARPISIYKRQSISQVYLSNNRQSELAANQLLLGTSLSNTPTAAEDQTFILSSSFTNTSPFLKTNKLNRRTSVDSIQKQDINDIPILPVINDQVHHQLTGTTTTDEILRNDFHYDQSPSISLCLSLIELHSDQYQCGKLLIKLCEYLSEQLSTKQRNNEIDYGLVLNIIKNLLFTAKMKLMTGIINDEQLGEQQKLISSCDIYNNLVDILNRLNMANCSLPALNDLLQQDTLRKVRNKLLDDERYQLAMDISTRCNLDTHTIWFQWGMTYLRIGHYEDARDKFDKCLQKNIETTDLLPKQQQRSSLSQEKILNDIISYLESSHSLKYSMKCQYLTEQQTRQAGQTRTSLKYLNSLSTMPRVSSQPNKVIQDEILFYLTTYSDDAHLLDYYIRHELYTQAFEYKCSLAVFRDHIYIPLLKRNHIKHLFNYVSFTNNYNSFAHHLKFICTYLKEQEMHHSLQQLQLFMNDFTNAAFTSIQLFTLNRTTYVDLYEKRLSHLRNALDCFQQVKADTDQAMMKIHSTTGKIDLQLELTRYIFAQLKRLNNNGSNILVNCPTLFDGKESVIKLITALITISDTIANALNFINKIINAMNFTPTEVFVPCAEQIGKRRDYRSLQQLLQLIRENGYTDNKLHDDIIESCVRQSGSDVEQSREQDTLIQMIKNDDTRINVYMAVGKLRAAYLIAIRLGREDKVRSIRDDAQKSGQTAVYDICKKWLENRASEQ